MIDELFAKFEGAFAENTIRGYRHDFDQFAKWCSNEGIPPPYPRLQSALLPTLTPYPRPTRRHPSVGG
jgi:hypothetical protein